MPVTTTIHPQMLRLDELAVSDQQQQQGLGPLLTAAGHSKADTLNQNDKLVPFNPQLKADAWLLQMDLKGA